MTISAIRPRAFTLIELLVVISIIAVLMGLAFPVFQGVQNSARKTQAKNDVVQVVTALNAFYTEYGRYPCGANPGGDGTDFFAGDDDTHAKLMTDLRGIGYSDPAINPRLISFIQVPTAKVTAHAQARSGICGGGHFHDPWGSTYRMKLDNNYNNTMENPYADDSGAGFAVLNLGVIAWSLGKDGDGARTGVRGNGGPKNTGKSQDDVISW